VGTVKRGGKSLDRNVLKNRGAMAQEERMGGLKKRTRWGEELATVQIQSIQKDFVSY